MCTNNLVLPIVIPNLEITSKIPIQSIGYYPPKEIDNWQFKKIFQKDVYMMFKMPQKHLFYLGLDRTF